MRRQLADTDGAYMEIEVEVPRSTSHFKWPLLSQSGPFHESNKRKYDKVEGTSRASREPFSIQIGPLATTKPTAETYFPKLFLSRACLPFAFLDPVTDIAGLRLFTANIQSLDPLEDAGIDQAVVLLVESKLDHHFHAIERAQKGVYSLRRLASWVTLQALQELGRVNRFAVPRTSQQEDRDGLSPAKWWVSAAVATDATPSNFESTCRKRRAPRIPKFTLCRALYNRNQGSPFRATDYPIVADARDEMPDSSPDLAFQEPENVLSLINSQYQESLYVSKASLAYFAKGPLSRARACFQYHDESPRNCSHLIAHLRSLVLTIPIMDKKYRETIPNLIKDLPFSVLSEDDGISVPASMLKTRRSKKVKLSRNGLYPNEESSIARWWINRDIPDVACDTIEAREEYTRSLLLEQRFRETQLQIILVLETLALESSRPNLHILHERSEGQLNIDESKVEKTKKPKRSENLTTVLDLLIDRLSIWQSMTTEETRPSSDQQGLVHQVGEGDDERPLNRNLLQQFCIDVVLPFYGARLPDKTTSLCQKLGILKNPSPKRQPLAKHTTTKLGADAAVSRQQPRKTRKTLERVLTEERPSRRQYAPSLSRSATEPSLPQMKREVSEVSFKSIPLNRVTMSKRYSQREIDLHAASQTTEAKLKKKTGIERELQGAIAALKKPNRRMAAKELVEAAEKRAAVPCSKKLKNSVRNPVAQRVQITATPCKNRQSHPILTLPQLPQATENADNEMEEVPPSSISKVPCSSTKVTGSSAADRRAATAIGQKVVNITEQTPTRGSSKYSCRPSWASKGPASLSKTPQTLTFGKASQSAIEEIHTNVTLQATPPNVHETPSKIDRHVQYTLQSRDDDDVGIAATPVKAKNLEGASKDAPPQQLTPAPKCISMRHVRDDDVDELSWSVV